jgi:uncharacterized integral membrane protein
MERKTLQDTAAHSPYLQGLWPIPLGLTIMVAGMTNLQAAPSGLALLGLAGGGLLLAAAVAAGIARHYRNHYGQVTPTTNRRARYAVAALAWVGVLFVASSHALWSPSPSISLFTSAFALATLALYAILVGIRPHHAILWGAILAAGLLPIWGGLGADRDALAMFPLGGALVVTGLLDQRLLARDLRGVRPVLEPAGD